MNRPDPVDPEIAAATFDSHLTQFFRIGRGTGEGWERVDLDPLHAVVRVPATRPDGTKDHYFVHLGAEYYDVWPPTTAFVRPDGEGGWPQSAPGSRWWPNQQNSPGFPFGLHHNRTFTDGSVGQLLCFSHTFEYYISDHNAGDTEKWRQGTHTVSATLTRIAIVLTAPNYQGPSGDIDT
jgi:hypothetical protein